MQHPIVILDPVVPRPPGKCDSSPCEERARYSYRSLYLCAEHLIDACQGGFVTGDEVIYRVPEYEKGS